MTALHFSDLKRMSQSARHYRDALDAHREVTRSMRIGTAVHAMVLGGTAPPVYTGKRQGNAWDAFVEANAPFPRDEIMTETEFEDALDCATAIKAHPVARRYLADSRTEVPLAWTIGKFQCETRGIDILAADRFGDLKTVPTCDPRKLVRHCEAMLYHAQIAWYDMGLEATGYAPRTRPPFLLCAEAKRPHDVVALELPPETIEAGKRMCMSWLIGLQGATETGVWSGYSDAPIPFELYGAGIDFEDGADE